MIVLSICLSEIPNSACKKSESNGKIYCSIVVDKRKEKDKYDNTHTVYINQTKEERAEKKDKQYIGSGKEFVFEHKEVPVNNPFDSQSEPLKVNDQPKEPYEYSDNGQSESDLPF